MDPSKWFWLVIIAATCLIAGIFRFKSQRHIRDNPELADGYAKIFRGIVIWGNIPWIVMGLGIIVGGVPSVRNYFRPRDGNPFVLAHFVSVFLIWTLGTYWLFFRGGAEMLVKHPGLFNVDIKSPLMLKLLWILCLACGIGAVIMLFFFTDVPVL